MDSSEYHFLSVCGAMISVAIRGAEPPSEFRHAFVQGSNEDTGDTRIEFVVTGGIGASPSGNGERLNATFLPEGQCKKVWYRGVSAEIDEAGQRGTFSPSGDWERTAILMNVVAREMLFAQRVALPLHASAVACGRLGCVFVAPSNGGKTTVATLRQERSLVHDDTVYLRLSPEAPISVYPGLQPCQSYEGVPSHHGPQVNKIVLLEKAAQVAVREAYASEAFHSLCFSALSVLPLSRRNASRLQRVVTTVREVTRRLPVYTMSFGLNPSFWKELCRDCEAA